MQEFDTPDDVIRTWPSTLTFSPDGRYLVLAAWQHQVLDTTNYIVMGRLLAIHVDDALFDGDRIETARLDPVGRMAGSLYATMGKPFSLKRPTYAGLLEDGAPPMEPSGGR